jgi:hypothetical protein
VKFFIPLMMFCNVVWSQSNTKPVIHFEKEVCYAARGNNGEIELIQREWYCDYCNDNHIRRDTTGEITELADYDEKGELESFNMFTENPAKGLRYMNMFKTNESGESELERTVIYYRAVKIDSGWVSADSTFEGTGELEWVSNRYISADSLVEQYDTYYADGSLLYSYRKVCDGELPKNQKTTWLDSDDQNRYTTSAWSENPSTRVYIQYEEDGTISYQSREIYNSSEDAIYEYTWFSEDHIEEHWFSYVYDEFGNWTHKLVYNESKELIFVVEREILYWRRPVLTRK